MKTKNPNTFDVFDGLAAFDKQDREYFAERPLPQQKSFAPYVFQRWASGTKDPIQILCLNEFANPYVFSLGTEKDMLWRLMTSCATKSTSRYAWSKLHASTGKTPSVDIVMQFYGYNESDAIDALKLLKEDDVIEYANQLGVDDDVMKAITTEWKTKMLS